MKTSKTKERRSYELMSFCFGNFELNHFLVKGVYSKFNLWLNIYLQFPSLKKILYDTVCLCFEYEYKLNQIVVGMEKYILAAYTTCIEIYQLETNLKL